MLKYTLTAVILMTLACPLVGADKVMIDNNLVRITVTGVGMSEDEALHDAKRKAVEQGAGTYLHSQSKTRDFELVKDTILTRSTGFIQEYETVAKKEMEDGSWEVKIIAVVSIQGIQDVWGAVKALLEVLGRPKIMVHVQEKIDNETVDVSTVQTRIENLLLKNGFLLVNREQLKAIDLKDLDAAVAENDPSRVQAIAKRFGAQLFLTGTATATRGEVKRVSGMTLYPYQTNANIKCYRSDTAQLLSSIPGPATRGVDRVWRSAANKSLDAQAQQIAPASRNDILRFWQDVLEGRGEVQLKVSQVTFKQYMAIKKALKGIEGVKSVNAKYSNKNVDCSIECEFTAEMLAEKIAESIENLEITDLTQNVIKGNWSEN